MSDLLTQYKAFWKQVAEPVKAHGITGFYVTFSGGGDEGQIDEIGFIKDGKRTVNRSKKNEVDSYGNEVRPHPWLHKNEDIVLFEDVADILVPDVKTFREKFQDGKWVKEEVITSVTLEELTSEIMYEVMNEWFSGWETDDGSFGTIYMYPRCVEYEFGSYFENSRQRGVSMFSNSVQFKDFQDWDYDCGFRGRHVDEVFDESEDEDDEK